MTEQTQRKVSSFEIEEPAESKNLPGKQLGSPNSDFTFYFTPEPSLGERFLDFIESSWLNVTHKTKRPLTKSGCNILD